MAVGQSLRRSRPTPTSEGPGEQPRREERLGGGVPTHIWYRLSSVKVGTVVRFRLRTISKSSVAVEGETATTKSERHKAICAGGGKQETRKPAIPYTSNE